MGETVLLEIECRCGSTWDAYGEEQPNGSFDVDRGEMRCPGCTAARRPTRVVRISERESLA